MTVSEMRVFLGFCNYYSGYVRIYAEMAASMKPLLRGNRVETKKGSEKPFVWDDKGKNAFGAMKCALRESRQRAFCSVRTLQTKWSERSSSKWRTIEPHARRLFELTPCS